MNRFRFFILSLALIFVYVTVGHSFDTYIPYNDKSYIVPLNDFEGRYLDTKYNLSRVGYTKWQCSICLGFQPGGLTLYHRSLS